jgi:hypothetical protein
VTPEEAVRRAYRVALGRGPTDSELGDAVDFLREQEASYRANVRPNPGPLALADFCQAVMSLNEFIYVD